MTYISRYLDVSVHHLCRGGVPGGLPRPLRVVELKGPWKWVGGFVSGTFGGLVGNQGGIRSAAMLGFNLAKESFIATATAIALVVDGFRMPVYFVTQHERIAAAWTIVAIAAAG